MHDLNEGLRLGWGLEPADTERLHLMVDKLMKYLENQVRHNHRHATITKAYKTRYYRVKLQDFGSGEYWRLYWHPTMHMWRKA